MKKKLLSISLISSVLLIGMGLTSCNSTPSKVEDDLQFDEFGDPIFDNVKLNVLSIIGEPDNTYLDKVNRMFNDYYNENGIEAKITSVTNSDFYTQLANTINTDPERAPDVVIIHSERLSKLAKDKILLPMDEYFDLLKNDRFDENDYFPNLIEECKYQDKLYGVPLDVHSGVWYYRKDILEKNNIPVPTDLNSFVSTCNQLIEKYNKGELYTRAMDKNNPANCEWTTNKDFGKEYSPVVMSSAGGIETGWIPQTAVFQNGGKLTDDKGYPAWNTEGLTKSMKMLRDWQTGENTLKDANNKDLFNYKGKFVSGDNDYNTVWSKLSSGEAVFSCEGPWWAEKRIDEYNSVLKEKEDVDGNKYEPLGVLNLSSLYAFDSTADYADSIYGVGHCFSVCKTVKSKTKILAASLYGKFMSENSIDYLQGGHLPAYKAAMESEQLTSKPFYDKYLKDMGTPQDHKMLGNTPYYSAVYEKLKAVYQDIFTDSKDNKTVEELIEARYNEAIKEIKSLEDL